MGGQSAPDVDFALCHGVAWSYARNLAKGLVCLGTSADDFNNKDSYEVYTNSLSKIVDLIMPIYDTYKTLFSDDAQMKIKEVTEGLCSEAVLNHALSEARLSTKRDVQQAMEAVIHNMNMLHSRSAGQVPFSGFNYGMCTSTEGRMVIDSLLDAIDAGLGKGETALFPVSIFLVKEGVNYNPGDPNYDLYKKSMVVSAHRMYPNYEFLDSKYNLAYYKDGDPDTYVATMGCRTRVMANVNGPSTTSGRGNLSFTTINLPRIAIQAGGDQVTFFEKLDYTCNLVIHQLLERFKLQSHLKVKNMPFVMGQGLYMGSDKLKSEDYIYSAVKHGTLTLGFCGLAECLVVLNGKHHGEDDISQSLGIRIIKRIREHADTATNRYALNFSTIASPSESTASDFLRKDRKEFGIIKGVTDREYYTNSNHVPVYYNIDIFRKIDIEAPYHNICNGGHICYVEYDGDPLQNIPAFEAILRHAHDAGIGYFAISHPVDYDPMCGYTGIIGDVCPKCGRREDEIPFQKVNTPKCGSC